MVPAVLAHTKVSILYLCFITLSFFQTLGFWTEFFFQPNCCQKWISFLESLSKGGLSILENERNTLYKNTVFWFVLLLFFKLKCIEVES